MVFVYILLFISIALSSASLYITLVRKHHNPSSSVIPPSNLRIGLVKFNPFSDTGGEQSFVLSLLDGGGSGILFTSLHGRGITRVYSKRVIAGKADQELSAEEKQALSQALSQQI